MNVKTKLLTSLLLITTLVLLYSNPTSAEDYNILSIDKEPPFPIQGHNLTISVNFETIYNETDHQEIFNVKLLVCQISPEFKCEAQPILMELKSLLYPSAQYQGKFLVYYPNGTAVGYHVLITYQNFTTIIIPNSPSFQGMAIIEPVSGEFFFDAGVVGQNPVEQTAGIGFMSSGLILLLYTLYNRSRKKKF